MRCALRGTTAQREVLTQYDASLALIVQRDPNTSRLAPEVITATRKLTCKKRSAQRIINALGDHSHLSNVLEDTSAEKALKWKDSVKQAHTF